MVCDLKVEVLRRDMVVARSKIIEKLPVKCESTVTASVLASHILRSGVFMLCRFLGCGNTRMLEYNEGREY